MKNTLFLLTVFLAFSCSNNVDVAQVEEELLMTDAEFSDFSLETGYKSAFAAYCAEDGVLLRPGLYPVTGRGAVIGLLEKVDDSEIIATWEPMHAKVALSGELGYTYGIYMIKSISDSVIDSGTYVTIWEKIDDEWKFLLDSGNSGLGE